MNGNLLIYVLDGKLEEKFIENTKEALNTAEEIAQKGCNVDIYSVDNGNRAEDWWYSATWSI